MRPRLISSATAGLRAQRIVGLSSVLKLAIVVPHDPAPRTVTFMRAHSARIEPLLPPVGMATMCCKDVAKDRAPRVTSRTASGMPRASSSPGPADSRAGGVKASGVVRSHHRGRVSAWPTRPTSPS